MSSARRSDGAARPAAARERGRAKVRSATTTVTVASVVTAGARALALPGSGEQDHIQRIRLDRLVDLLVQLRLRRFPDQLRLLRLEFDRLGRSPWLRKLRGLRIQLRQLLY